MNLLPAGNREPVHFDRSDRKKFIRGMVKASSFEEWVEKRFGTPRTEIPELMYSEKVSMASLYVFEQICLMIDAYEEEGRKIDGTLQDEGSSDLMDFNSILGVDLKTLKAFIKAAVPMFLSKIGSIRGQDEIDVLAYKFYYFHIDFSDQIPTLNSVYKLPGETHPYDFIRDIFKGEHEFVTALMNLFTDVWNMAAIEEKTNRTQGDDDYKPGDFGDPGPLVPA